LKDSTFRLCGGPRRPQSTSGRTRSTFRVCQLSGWVNFSSGAPTGPYAKLTARCIWSIDSGVSNGPSFSAVFLRRRFGFRVSGFGFRVSGFGVSGFGFRVWDVGFRVEDVEFKVWGLEFRVQGSGFRFECTGEAPTSPPKCTKFGY